MTLFSNWISPFWFAAIPPAGIRSIHTILGRITCSVMAVMIRSAMLTTGVFNWSVLGCGHDWSGGSPEGP